LYPAGSNAFDEWLVQLDQLRISACRILESDEGKEARKLGAVPKILLRAAMAWDMTFAPVIVTAKSAAGSVETFAASRMPAGTTMHGIVRGAQSLPYPLEERFQEELAPAN
jgi:hypothetical protein